MLWGASCRVRPFARLTAQRFEPLAFTRPPLHCPTRSPTRPPAPAPQLTALKMKRVPTLSVPTWLGALSQLRYLLWDPALPAESECACGGQGSSEWPSRAQGLGCAWRQVGQAAGARLHRHRRTSRLPAAKPLQSPCRRGCTRSRT